MQANGKPSVPGTSTRGRRLLVGFIAILAIVAGGLLPAAQPAAAHSDGSIVHVYNPLIKGSDPNAVSGWWPWGSAVAPASHHIVWSNYGYPNDWAMDVFAKVSGRRVVTPFGSTTDTGHSVRSEVLAVAPACASGNIADGGYRIRIRATDLTTGAELGVADVAHVNNPQVGVGATLGPWTTIGYTSRFRYSSCYQVSSDNGIHLHLEVINKHNYACYYPRSYDSAMTGQTRLGEVAVHGYSGQRASC